MARSLTIAELVQQPRSVKAGDDLLLTGTLFTARDAAHKRLAHLIADMSRVIVPARSMALWSASALISVASIPMWSPVTLSIPSVESATPR